MRHLPNFFEQLSDISGTLFRVYLSTPMNPKLYRVSLNPLMCYPTVREYHSHDPGPGHCSYDHLGLDNHCDLYVLHKDMIVVRTFCIDPYSFCSFDTDTHPRHDHRYLDTKLGLVTDKAISTLSHAITSR
jgi:hypothetical protein